MAFKLIKGRYKVVGFSPDGDSIRFEPADANLLLSLAGPKPDNFTQGKSVQLRLEAIDALETHYSMGAASMQHQPRPVAEGACDRLMQLLGITNVQWTPDRSKVTAAKDSVEGYILARTFEKNRRPVAFAFAGATSAADGEEVFVDGGILRESVNYRMLADGLVYPTYYEGLFAPLRETMDEAASRAKSTRVPGSVWAIDATESGVNLPPLAAVVDQRAVLPKLFRRLSQYFKSASDLSGFKAFLEQSPDRCLWIPQADPTVLHRFVEVKGNRVRLTVPAEELLFFEK